MLRAGEEVETEDELGEIPWDVNDGVGKDDAVAKERENGNNRFKAKVVLIPRPLDTLSIRVLWEV